jgi:hypothetical protein
MVILPPNITALKAFHLLRHTFSHIFSMLSIGYHREKQRFKIFFFFSKLLCGIMPSDGCIPS